MDPVTAGWSLTILMVILIIMGMPVAFAMFIAGALGHILVMDVGGAIASIPIIFYDKMSNYALSVIPLFVVMGFLASEAGFAEDAYTTARKWTTRLPGGLAQATIAAGAAFGAACGTTIAACAALAKVCIPPMRKAGVNEKLAIGSVAAAGPLSILIPPSVTFPIYGMLTETSIGKLLMAGVFPGILQAAIMMAMIWIMCIVKPGLAPRGESVTWKERLSSLKNVWGIGLIFVIVIVGIYTGFVTPTEAGGLGALGALAVGLISRRLGRKGILYSLFEAARISCTILIITTCALYFAHFLALSRLPHNLTIFLASLQVSPLVILLGVVVLYTVMGCIMNTLSIMVLTLPIVFPILVAIGYDPIWFGVMTVILCELAALTPPFGLNLFILRSALPEVPMGRIIAGTFPFILSFIPMLALVIAFPQIALFLPSMMD
ncbi:TRAP transporter large permease [Chloroflexota bacterium]